MRVGTASRIDGRGEGLERSVGAQPQLEQSATKHLYFAVTAAAEG